MTCTHCGAAVRDGAELCPLCGASVKAKTSADSEKSASAGTTATEKPRKGNAGLLAGAITLIAVALLLIGGLIVGLLNGWFDDPEESELTPSEGLEYILLDDGTYSVAGIGTCTDAHVVIPSSFEGIPVTSIGEYAFSGSSGVTAVTIPDGVTSVGYNAFYSCSDLTSVMIPNSVTSIGDYAFAYCSGLTSVTIPDGAMRVGYNAFFDCSNLTTVYCKAVSQPYDWSPYWLNGCPATVYWGQ
ncbi:MAG: leucine-rich repeat protein [Clostridia bacterium]|nr:leucine-rich repeat protein [Clostridia bacterium]